MNWEGKDDVQVCHFLISVWNFYSLTEVAVSDVNIGCPNILGMNNRYKNIEEADHGINLKVWGEGLVYITTVEHTNFFVTIKEKIGFF